MTIALSIIVVSYNTREVTLACLASVYRYPPDVPFELILIDNQSADGSAAAVSERFPQVRLINAQENLGFARANNVAAREARGERLLLLNPDTLVFDGSLTALWDFAGARPDRGIWGGRTLFEDGSLNPTSCWGRITPWSLFCSAVGLNWAFPRSHVFNPESYGDWPRDTEREVDIVTGCFLLIDRSLWERLGGFDPLFFMYAEEADLCLRARALGYRPTVTPSAVIVHLGGRSEVSHVEKTIKTARGRMTLVRKHWRQPARGAGIALYTLWALLRYLASAFGGAGGHSGRAKWEPIWRRRGEWLAGYSSADSR
jgi:hypothetical protein